jgi:addiction module HigA family antidote
VEITDYREGREAAGTRSSASASWEILIEFLKPLRGEPVPAAREIGSRPADQRIVHGQRRISADTALRLARFFGTSERFWINLQSRYDLR